MRSIPRGALLVAIAALSGLAQPASARSEKTLAYPREQAWPTAVRFLVVNEHAKVTDKDAEAGYVLFDLRDDGKTFRGSLEIVTIVRDGRTAVRFVLQIADRPSWVETAMLARLETKLRAELGSPSPPPDPPAKRDEPKRDEPRRDEPKRDEPRRDDGETKLDDRGPPVSPTP